MLKKKGEKVKGIKERSSNTFILFIKKWTQASTRSRFPDKPASEQICDGEAPPSTAPSLFSYIFLTQIHRGGVFLSVAPKADLSNRRHTGSSDCITFWKCTQVHMHYAKGTSKVFVRESNWQSWKKIENKRVNVTEDAGHSRFAGPEATCLEN